MRHVLFVACALAGMGGTVAAQETVPPLPLRPGLPVCADAPAGLGPAGGARAAPEGTEAAAGASEPTPAADFTDTAAGCANAPGCGARADYLLWWLKPVCLKPPTLTAGSPKDAVPGALGQAHTRLLLGDHKFEFEGASGVRPAVGFRLTCDPPLTLEADGFLLEQATARQAFSARAGSPALYLPYQDPSNAQQALPFTVPGVVNGGSTATGSSRLWGAEADLAANSTTARGDFPISSALLVGLRYLDLRDRVHVVNTQNLVADPSVFAVGEDTFTTRNQFYGGQLGTRLGLGLGRWSADFQLKLAAGETHQVNVVAGQPLAARSGSSPLLLPGPLLALPSNVGRQSSDRFTLVPEIAVGVRCQLTDRLRLSLGYSALYWNKVLCPGDQMDPHVNVTQLPFHGPVRGPAVPAPLFVHTDAFAQGLNAGVEVDF